MSRVPQPFGEDTDDNEASFDGSGSDDGDTVYPLDEEGGTSSLDGDDVWLETPHPDGFGEMVMGEGGAGEDFETFLPEDTDMMAMLSALDNSNPRDGGSGGGMGTPSPSTSSAGSGGKVPKKIKWDVGTPDYVSRGASAVTNQLPLESKGSGMRGGSSSRGSVMEYPFFIPVLAYTEMHGSVEEDYARTQKELQRRQYMTRRRSQSFGTFKLSTSIQKLPPAMFRVVMSNDTDTTMTPPLSTNDIQEGFYTLWELRSTRIHPTFQSFRAPPFNAECKLFTDEEYRPLIPLRPSSTASSSSSTTAPAKTLRVDGGVCVKSWDALASSPHWGTNQNIPFQPATATTGYLHSKSTKDHITQLSGNRSLFPGIAGTSHCDSTPTPFTVISLPIRAGNDATTKKVEEDRDDDAATRRVSAPRGSTLAAVYKQRRPLRGWMGEDAEAGANSAVQHRSFPKDVVNTLSIGFTRPAPSSIPTIPQWVVNSEAAVYSDIKQSEPSDSPPQAPPTSSNINMVHLSSALTKVAKLIGTNAALQAALAELSTATTTSAPIFNIEGQ